VSLLIISTVVIPSQTEASPDENLRLSDKLLIGFFKISYKLGNPMMIPWKVLRFQEPVVFTAEPNVLDVGYLNTTKITLGSIDESTGSYKSTEDFTPSPLFPGEDYEFALEIPDSVPDGAIIAHFDPQSIVMGEKGELKTNITIITNIPENEPIPNDIILKVNITKYVTGGNLYLPPKGNRWPFLIKSLPWFLSSIGIGFPFPFGTFYSGKRVRDEFTIVDIQLKLNRFHLAVITPPKPMEIKPDQLINIPIEVTNLGSHIDSFNFNVSTGSGSELLVISQPNAITLEPSEVGRTSVAVASPLSFQDPGTAYSIYIEAYSIFQPEKVFRNTAIVVTKGIYLSQMNVMYSAFVAILILLAAGLFFYRRKRLFNKICQKPDKPWNIPEEKRHLEQLKKTNKDEYNNILNMMGNEYKSAVLWYKDYCKTMLSKAKARQKKKPTDIFSGIKNSLSNVTKRVVHIFSRPKKKIGKPVKAEPKKPLRKKITEAQKTEEVKPTEVMEEGQKPAVDLVAEREKRRREQAILRAKRAQEKQRRKFKRPAY